MNGALLLNVDDHGPGRYARSRLLKEAGYSVLEAVNGMDGLKLMHERAPSLVLLDVNLPDIDGFEVCRRIKGYPGFANTPVLHISASVISNPQQVCGLNNGADAYLVEPVDSEVLLATVRALLRMRHAEEELQRVNSALQTSNKALETANTALQSSNDELERFAKTAQRYQLMIDRAKDYALFTVNADGRVTSWNRGAEHLYGYKEAEVLGQDFSLLFTTEDIQDGTPGKLIQKAAQGSSSEDECWQIRKDGTRFLAVGLLTSIGQAGHIEFGRLIRDVTERRKTETELMHAHKLESIGVLAGGIAHDFNNLLTGILFSVNCAKTSVPPNGSAFPMLELAEQSIQKAAGLTSQLLAYAGKGQFVVARLNFSALISEMVSLIKTMIPKHVKLDLSLPFTLPWIQADASQIQQIVMNLVINGAEAISPAGGTLCVSTGVTDIGIDHYVFMKVQDSGSGMTEAVKVKIFDPFFTTKSGGRGLGLAAVAGIVQGHNGRMEVESAAGEGTTFKVFFPAVEAIPAAQISPSEEMPPASGTILVVDDEPVLRSLAQVILERRGYSVLVAENGLEAVDMFRMNAGNIAAVLLDLIMPMMGGGEAFRLIREIRADVPVIVASGYSELFAREQFVSATGIVFIQKPYMPATLAEKLSRLVPQSSRN